MYKAAVNFLRGQVLVHIESGCGGGMCCWRRRC